MKHIKYILAALSILAFMPVATAQRTREGSPIHVSKTVSGNHNDGYTLTLESFVQGSAHTEVEYVGADIALVMDMSSSMHVAVTYSEEWETGLPVRDFESTKQWTYQDIVSRWFYKYNGTLLPIVKENNNSQYSAYVRIDGVKKYMNGTATLDTEPYYVTTTNSKIYDGTLYTGLSYDDLKPVSNDLARPYYRFEYHYKHTDNQTYPVGREYINGNYAIYTVIGGVKQYLIGEGLDSNPPTTGTGYTTPLFFKPGVVTMDRSERLTSRLDGLKGAVNSFVEAMGTKAKLHNINHRISLICFNNKKWGYMNNEDSNLDLSRPHLKEYAISDSFYGNTFTFVAKDFVDVSKNGSEDLLQGIVNSFGASNGSGYGVGLSIANGLFKREGGDVTGYDYDGQNGIESFEKPIGTDPSFYTNYAERPKIVIIIGDGQTASGEQTDAETWASAIKSIPNATIFFIYVNPSMGSFNKAARMATSSDHVIKVDEYDDELIDALTDLTDHIGGAEIALGKETVVQDVVTSDFIVPEGSSSITVKTAPFKAIVNDDYTFDPAVAAADSIHVSRTTNDAGETVIKVDGFDFGENWCGMDDQTPHGNKLILEISINPDPDLIGGRIATNSPTSGLYYQLNGEEVFLPYPIPYINDIPLKLKIQKSGLTSSDEGAIFKIQAVDANGNPIAGQKPRRITIHQSGTDPVTAVIENLNIYALDQAGTDYYYTITEEGWSWSYNLTTPAETRTISTKDQHKNPFVFTNSKKSDIETKYDEKHIYVEHN